MSSNFEDLIEELLEEAFPRCTVFPQYSVKFEGNQFFIDFFIPSMHLAIECQGEQHYKFVPHFHRDIPFNQVPDTAAGLFNLIYEQAKK